MTEKREIPRPGDFYRHFKDKLYQIIAMAYQSETGEEMVVYQALYGSYRVWVRPLSMFMEEVDKKKYPESGQKYRFERVEMTEAIPGEKEAKKEATVMNPHLLAFFDAMDDKDYDKMLEALRKLSEKATQKEMDDIYMVLDMQPAAGSILEQAAAVKGQIQLLKKFDGERLR